MLRIAHNHEALAQQVPTESKLTQPGESLALKPSGWRKVCLAEAFRIASLFRSLKPCGVRKVSCPSGSSASSSPLHAKPWPLGEPDYGPRIGLCRNRGNAGTSCLGHRDVGDGSSDVLYVQAMSGLAWWIQPIDATPLHSNLAHRNGMHMQGHARTWFTQKLKAEP